MIEFTSTQLFIEVVRSGVNIGDRHEAPGIEPIALELLGTLVGLQVTQLLLLDALLICLKVVKLVSKRRDLRKNFRAPDLSKLLEQTFVVMLNHCLCQF